MSVTDAFPDQSAPPAEPAPVDLVSAVDDVLIGQWVLAAAFVVYFVVRTGGVLQTAV